MIFCGFIAISSIFFIFAAISGNVFNFVNYDSLAVVLAAVVLFSIFTFRWEEFVKGVKSMFVFNIKEYQRDKKTAAHYRVLMLVSVTAGLVSSCQGFISYALAIRDGVPSAIQLPVMESLCYTGFSTVYAIMLSVFLFYPVYLLQAERE